MIVAILEMLSLGKRLCDSLSYYLDLLVFLKPYVCNNMLPLDMLRLVVNYVL